MFTPITPPSSSFSSFSLLLLLSSVLVLTTSTEQLLCHEDDLRALLEIKKSLGNPSILSSWNESIPCCQWYNGVYCDADGGGRVTQFTLQYTNITAAIPPAIGRLSRVRFLLIVGNPNLTGTIPPSFGYLKDLTYLRISENPLVTGIIPTSLCRLSKLEELRLNLNSLTGSIPSCFPLGLETLTVDHNRLQGRIPQQIAKLEKLTQFDVSYNYLCGPIPTGKYLETLLPASFVHNKCLCGLPLKPCHK